jgi:hypothetical protein
MITFYSATKAINPPKSPRNETPTRTLSAAAFEEAEALDVEDEPAEIHTIR